MSTESSGLLPTGIYLKEIAEWNKLPPAKKTDQRLTTLIAEITSVINRIADEGAKQQLAAECGKLEKELKTRR